MVMQIHLGIMCCAENGKTLKILQHEARSTFPKSLLIENSFYWYKLCAIIVLNAKLNVPRRVLFGGVDVNFTEKPVDSPYWLEAALKQSIMKSIKTPRLAQRAAAKKEGGTIHVFFQRNCAQSCPALGIGPE